MSARAAQDFALALRSGPFRVALLLSLIVHLVLLVVVGRGGAGGEIRGHQSIPLMRVRLIRAAAQPDPAPVAPAERTPPGRP